MISIYIVMNEDILVFNEVLEYNEEVLVYYEVLI